MWVVAVVMGLVVLAMVLLDHKTGKPKFLANKSNPVPISPPPSVPPTA